MIVPLVTFSMRGTRAAVGDEIAESLREDGLDVVRRSFGAADEVGIDVPELMVGVALRPGAPTSA